MTRTLPLLALLALPLLSGCFSQPLDCQTDALQVSGNVVDEEGEGILPQAAIVDLVHSPDGCIVQADIRVIGAGGQDCELRAVATEPRADGGLLVTEFTLNSTGDCGWPTSVNGNSAGTGDSWVELVGGLDYSQVTGSNICATGELVLTLDVTLNGNSSEQLTGSFRFNDGMTSVEDRSATCPTE